MNMFLKKHGKIGFEGNNMFLSLLVICVLKSRRWQAVRSKGARPPILLRLTFGD